MSSLRLLYVQPMFIPCLYGKFISPLRHDSQKQNQYVELKVISVCGRPFKSSSFIAIEFYHCYE